MNTIFITGGTGCIGSVTIAKLLASDEVDRIIVASRSNNTEVLSLWLGANLDPRIEFVSLDVSDYSALESTLLEINPSHIVHLGAYQSPDCAKNHLRGMQINLGGTMALFDAAEKLSGLQRFVFASSAAVYGMRSMYPQAIIAEDVPLAPPNHYGIWKLGGEHLARLFHDASGVSTVCLRLNTTYGKGRDKGLTSAPTNAIKAISMGSISKQPVPFAMPYQGRENYHFVEDVGAHFAQCTLQPYSGFGAFNIKGRTIAISDFLKIVSEQAGELGMGDYVDLSIAEGANPNLFVCDLDHGQIDRTFSGLPLTPIRDGVRKSLLEFKAMAEKGLLDFSTAAS